MATAETIPVFGATPQMEKRIRDAIRMYPSWMVNGARLSKIQIKGGRDMQALIASYEHADRGLYIYPDVGMILQKAIGHELGHAFDDNFGLPHYFTSTDEWGRIHRAQPYFDLPKYRDEPLEYFADMVTKYFMLGRDKLRISNPDEVSFLEGWVFPVLQATFGG